MLNNNHTPIKIALKYNCYICSQEDFIDATRLRKHLCRIHKVLIPPRTIGNRHRSGKQYKYVKESSTDAVIHHSCPSCLKHFLGIEELRTHVTKNHLATESPINCAIIESGTSLSFISPLIDENTCSASVPKLTWDTVQELSNIIILVTPYNKNLSSENLQCLQQQEADQGSLSSLKQFPLVHKLLIDILDIVDYDEWPLFLWNYDANTTDDLEKKLLNAAKYILTDFSSKCNRPLIFQPKGERTFWIDRVIPIFQTLGDQTGYIGFEWCEVEPKDYNTYTMDTLTWKRTSRRNVDGIGYNNKKKDQIVLECSGGLHKEIIDHVVNDSLKNIYSTICMIDRVIKENMDVNFSTVMEVESVCIQTYGKNITLSTTSLNKTSPEKYIHIQRRNATIPVNFDERDEWILLFELLSFLTILLKKQHKVREIIGKEKNRILEVSDETVANVLKTAH